MRSSASVRLTWPSMQFCPGRRVRVLEVGHEHLRARVEGVDHHLAVDRAGDLDAAVLQLGRRRRRPASRPRAPRASPGGSRAARPPRAARRARAAAASSSRRRGPKRRSRSVRNSIASGVSTSSIAHFYRTGDGRAPAASGRLRVRPVSGALSGAPSCSGGGSMTLTLGLLSTAKINAAILKAARGTDRVRVVAVASRDGARAQAYASEHGLERAHASYDALLADDAVDAVYISLPNGMHHEWSVRALAAGKHVLCEKPYTRDPAEVEEAWDAAEAAGLVADGGVHVPPPSPDPKGLRARRVGRDRGAPRRQDDLQLPSRRPLRRARPARAGRRRPDGRRLATASAARGCSPASLSVSRRSRSRPRRGSTSSSSGRSGTPATSSRRSRRRFDAPRRQRLEAVGHGGHARARGSVARGLGRRDPRRARRGGRADPDPARRLVPAGAGEPRRRGRGPGRAAARPRGRARAGADDRRALPRRGVREDVEL